MYTDNMYLVTILLLSFMLKISKLNYCLCSVVMLVWVFYRAFDRQGVLQCITSNEAAQSQYNNSSVEFQNEADDTDAKACAPRWEVMSLWPAKTVSVQIQLDVRRPDKFNYPKNTTKDASTA